MLKDELNQVPVIEKHILSKNNNSFYVTINGVKETCYVRGKNDIKLRTIIKRVIREEGEMAVVSIGGKRKYINTNFKVGDVKNIPIFQDMTEFVE